MSQGGAHGSKSGMVTICHKTGSASNAWLSLEVPSGAVSDHLLHGDVLPDADADGYTTLNPCGIGLQNDCADTNAAINPAASEVCGNGVDDNCDGQIDETCAICNQVWMPRNLDVTKYRNGDDILYAGSLQEWVNAGANQTGAWCYYADNSAYGPVYGKLYNWYAVNDSRGLAPVGWHIPTDAEFAELYDCVGGIAVAGGMLKEAGLAHWNSPNLGATNSKGFTALPGGLRNFDGVFYFVGNFSVWWTATQANTGNALSRAMYYNQVNAGGSPRSKMVGFSVRCIRD